MTKTIKSWIWALKIGLVRMLGFEPIKIRRKMRPPIISAHPHPEKQALARYAIGRGLDVGCGSRKVAPHCIGVDVLAPGEVGADGVMDGEKSQADIQASGDELPMFMTGELDYVVSSHNFEHYLDPVKTLTEWRRILRIGGILAMVVPDDAGGDTIFLDPTHKHAYTGESLNHLMDVVGGLHVLRTEAILPGWSFILVAEKTADGGCR